MKLYSVCLVTGPAGFEKGRRGDDFLESGVWAGNGVENRSYISLGLEPVLKNLAEGSIIFFPPNRRQIFRVDVPENPGFNRIFLIQKDAGNFSFFG